MLSSTMKIIRSIENVRIPCDYFQFSKNVIKKNLLPSKIILVFIIVFIVQ